jgi:hypothetical protein
VGRQSVDPVIGPTGAGRTQLVLEVPPGRLAERAYTARVLFEELIGLGCEVRPSQRPIPVLSCPGAEGEIRLADGFLALPEQEWLTADSVPAAATPWPIPESLRSAAAPESLFLIAGPDHRQAELTITGDLLGTAFFFLTRYEEVAAPALDGHGRHRADGTLAGRGGWLGRPVVNEIAEVLWASIERQWPGVVRVQRKFRLLVSHDVDHPRCISGRSGPRLVAGAARALVRQGWQAAARRLDGWSRVRRGGAKADPCWTFDWLMTESERRGVRSAFYFIPGGGKGAEYRLGDREIADLMAGIAARGHEAGFHPSYDAADQPQLFNKELSSLRDACEAAGLPTTHLGGRHHYLRWRADRSWAQWHAAGLEYDSSVGFASAPGFRAGICSEYSTFDLARGMAMPFRERPLVVMDVSLLDKIYLGLSHGEAVDRAVGLARTCRRYQGDFVLLWHNDQLWTPTDREAYLAILDGCRES